ncbi:MAG: xylulokinase [Actinomycetota bacterium]|nr:xylulokinase [Actinomycetota bacterium]
MTRQAVAIDLGTTGLKVAIVALTGEVAWSGSRQLTTELGPGGAATQDANEWWRLIAELVREGASHADDIVAVACTGQWASTVPVDASGAPVGDCVMWMDTRGGRHSRKVIAGPVVGLNPRAALTWVRKTGGAPSATGSDPIGHMLHLQHDQPAVHAAARWYLEPVDYVSMRFTGAAAASHASMTAAWLTDNRRLDVLDYDDALVRRAGVDRSKLAPLYPSGAVIGEVRADVARDLGFPGGVQVVTGVPDLHSAGAGTGAVTDFATHLAISTTGWISCPVPFKKTSVSNQIASIPGLTRGGYVIVDNHETAGRCLHWLRDTVFPDRSYDELGALAAAAPPGSGGVVFTPWLAGERSPVDDRHARAGFHNLSLTTTPADLVRAVLEGVAYNSRWLHDAVERFAKRRLDPIRIFGGGAVSDLWCQIHADVMDRTIERVVDPLNCNARGAALIAGVALGDVRSSELASRVGIERTFTPDPAHRAVYDRLFAELPFLYKVQKPMFARLNRHH